MIEVFMIFITILAVLLILGMYIIYVDYCDHKEETRTLVETECAKLQTHINNLEYTYWHETYEEAEKLVNMAKGGIYHNHIRARYSVDIRNGSVVIIKTNGITRRKSEYSLDGFRNHMAQKIITRETEKYDDQ
jgi:hypothetical protein